MRPLSALWRRFRRTHQPTPGAVAAYEAAGLDTPLLMLSPEDAFTVRQATEGIAIWGAPGAAKSSATGRPILLSMVSLGMGGFVACVKEGEARAIVELVERAGRSASLVVVRPGGEWTCNLMEYLARTAPPGAVVNVLTNFLMEAVELNDREGAHGGMHHQFFQRWLEALVRAAITALLGAQLPPTPENLDRFVMSAPTSHEQVKDPEWQEGSYCHQVINAGFERVNEDPTVTQRERLDHFDSGKLFIREWCDFPIETRQNILATWKAAMDTLLHGALADLFFGTTTFVPEMALDGGAVIVTDMPIKTYGRAGRVLQGLFKLVFQMAAERRVVTETTPAAFVYVDEAHALASVKHDADFIATARSARVATVLISQNLANYQAAMGGADGAAKVESLLGNISTHIFHANGHHATNKWASDMIAEHTRMRGSYQSRGDEHPTRGGGSESVEKKVFESTFTTLLKGGPPAWVSEAIVFRAGGAFNASGEPFLRVAFRQLLLSGKGG